MVTRAAMILAVLAGLSGLASAAPTPAITTPVNDRYGSLFDADARAIETLIVDHRKATGVHIAVLIVGTTSGEPIEDYSMRVASAWGGGGKKRDDGILLVLAMTDRRARIEVGYDLEANLTDGEAKRILDGMGPEPARWPHR